MTRPARPKNDEWLDEKVSKSDDLNDSEEYASSDYDKSTYDYKFKICLLGDAGVGKTVIIVI